MKLRIPGIAGCIFLSAAGVLWGQDPAGPPARVARLSSFNGSVAFRSAGVDEWSAAEVNRPLATGDRLWTDEESHADVHAGATAVHLAPLTALAILRLDDRVWQMSLSQGAINVRVPRMDEGEVFEIATPNGAIGLLQPGDYRIEVPATGEVTLVTVRSGDAEAAAGGQTFPVHAGQLLRLFGG